MNYATGALKNPKDLRDIQISQVQAPTAVPSKYFTDISMLPVLNQKQIGACVGHAVATVMAYQNYKETGKYEYLSPRFIYALSKKIDGYEGEGTFPRVAGSVAVKSGCALDDLVKNNTDISHTEYTTITVTDEITKNALTYKSGGYAFVPVDASSLKQAIYKNGVICIAIGCGEINQFEIKPGTANGSHYVVVFGYEDTSGDTIFHYRNSWSDVWGKKGNGTFSSNAFKGGFMQDAMVLTDIPNTILEQARAKYKYFSEKEIIGLKPALVKLLDEARDIAGVPFKINSGFRTKEQNQKAGGVPDSAHLSGMAVDIACTSDGNRFKIVTALLKVGFNRIGLAQTFIHCDLDNSKAQNVVWFYK